MLDHIIGYTKLNTYYTQQNSCTDTIPDWYGLSVMVCSLAINFCIHGFTCGKIAFLVTLVVYFKESWELIMFQKWSQERINTKQYRVGPSPHHNSSFAVIELVLNCLKPYKSSVHTCIATYISANYWPSVELDDDCELVTNGDKMWQLLLLWILLLGVTTLPFLVSELLGLSTTCTYKTGHEVLLYVMYF